MANPSYLYVNNAQSSLLGNVGPTDPTITLPNGEGARFPNPTAGQSFMITIEDTSGNIEIVECTARTADVLTITRGREGTLARAFSAGTKIEARATAGLMGWWDWTKHVNVQDGPVTLDATVKIPIGYFDTPLQTYGDARWNAKLNFTPVQQGGGAGQGTNKIYLGWATGSKLKLQVDTTDQGNVAMESWVVTASVASAAKLTTSRSINLTGVVTGGVFFDGTANVTIGTSMAANAISISNVNGLQGALDSKATNNATNNANITWTGTVTAGAIVDNSDISLKENVRPMTLERAKSIVVGLTAYDYRHKVLQRESIGGVAQDIRKTVPEVVFEGEDGLLSVQYAPLVMPLATMVTYLLDEMERLRARVQELESR